MAQHTRSKFCQIQITTTTGLQMRVLNAKRFVVFIRDDSPIQISGIQSWLEGWPVLLRGIHHGCDSVKTKGYNSNSPLNKLYSATNKIQRQYF
jgi:hypothetical protein